MATVFIGLVLITFIANAIITKSKTKWWRDPGSLFRPESDHEPEPTPAYVNERVRQPWEVTPRQEAHPRQEVLTPAGARPRREPARSRRAAQPRTETGDWREVTPRRELAAQAVTQHAPQAPAQPTTGFGRHAMRSNPAPAVPIEFAETEIIARIPSGVARY
jgi:hypothetical protein